MGSFEPVTIRAGWTICFRCRGFGMIMTNGGDMSDCWVCDGEGTQRKRDEKGRYCK